MQGLRDGLDPVGLALVKRSGQATEGTESIDKYESATQEEALDIEEDTAKVFSRRHSVDGMRAKVVEVNARNAERLQQLRDASNPGAGQTDPLSPKSPSSPGTFSKSQIEQISSPPDKIVSRGPQKISSSPYKVGSRRRATMTDAPTDKLESVVEQSPKTIPRRRHSSTGAEDAEPLPEDKMRLLYEESKAAIAAKMEKNRRRESTADKSLKFAVEVLSDAFAHEDEKRKASLRILLGMLCSHRQQIAFLGLATQEVLVRRVLAMMMGNADAIVRANMFQAWAKALKDVHREQRTMRLLNKTAHRYEIRDAFAVWCSETQNNQSVRTRQNRTLAGIQEAWFSQKEDSFAEWKRMLMEHKKQLQTTQKLLKSLIGGDQVLAMRSSLSAWHNVVINSRAIQNSAKRFMAGMSGQMNEYYVQSTFTEWGRLAKERLKAMKEQSRLLKMFGNQSTRVVYRESWDAWHKFHEGVQQDLKHARKVLNICIGNNASMVLRSAYQSWLVCWRDAARIRMGIEAEEARERAVLDAASSATLAAQAKAREEKIQQIRQTFQKMAGLEGQVLLSNCFVGWWQPIAQAKKAQKAAAKLLFGNAQMVLSTSFVGWHRHASTMRHRRQAGMQKTTLLMANDGQMLIMQTLACWKRWVDRSNKEREEEELRKQKEQSVSRSIMMKFANESSFVLSNCFTLWANLVGDLRNERQNETKMLRLLMGAQGKETIRITFKGWIDVLKTLRNERMHAAQKRGKKAVLNSAQRMLMAQLSQNQAMAASDCFATWVQHTYLVQKERALEKVNATKLRELISGQSVAQLQERQFKKTLFVCWILGAQQEGSNRHLQGHTRILRNIQETMHQGKSHLVLLFALTAWQGWSLAFKSSAKCLMLEGEINELQRRAPNKAGCASLESDFQFRTAEWNEANSQLTSAVQRCAQHRKHTKNLYHEDDPRAEQESASWSAVSHEQVIKLTELELASRSVAERCTELASINARLCPSPSSRSASQVAALHKIQFMYPSPRSYSHATQAPLRPGLGTP